MWSCFKGIHKRKKRQVISHLYCSGVLVPPFFFLLFCVFFKSSGFETLDIVIVVDFTLHTLNQVFVNFEKWSPLSNNK